MHVQLKGVGKSYRPRDGEPVVAVTGVDLEVRDREFVSLVGPSGCGKTTILNMVMGLLRPTEGEIHVDLGGEDRKPGVVFQRSVLMEWRTALENVLLPSEITPGALGGDDRRTGRRRMEARARDLLRMVGLEGFEDKYPAELSGGMAQRVAIARALLLQSELLCLDEPFSALDEFTREQMNEQLLDIWSSEGLTCMFVTHNLFEAVFLSDRVVVMASRPGRVVAEVEVALPRPRTREMITSPQAVELVARMRAVMNAEREAQGTSPAREGSGV